MHHLPSPGSIADAVVATGEARRKKKAQEVSELAREWGFAFQTDDSERGDLTI